MWNFDHSKDFSLIHHFRIPSIHKYGSKDLEKREDIRRCAAERFPSEIFNYRWYGFRIKVNRNMLQGKLDVENVPKLILESFSGLQMDQDKSKYSHLELYPDDHLGYVKAIQIDGELTLDEDNTEVWIFGKK